MRLFSTIKKETHQFHMIKSIKEVTFKTRETYFLCRNPQKLKIAKNVFRKLFSKNLLKIFVSRYVAKSRKKNEKWPAIAEMIN